MLALRFSPPLLFFAFALGTAGFSSTSSFADYTLYTISGTDAAMIIAGTANYNAGGTVTHRQSFDTAFGDRAGIEWEWRRYMRTLRTDLERLVEEGKL